MKTPSEFLDHIRQVIDDAFANDNLMLTKALEKFLVFSSFLKEDSVFNSIQFNFNQKILISISSI